MVVKGGSGERKRTGRLSAFTFIGHELTGAGMRRYRFAGWVARTVRSGLVTISLLQFSVGSIAAPGDKRAVTTSPIKHVIIIIGENRSFDHVFATYVPKKGEFVWNLLSGGIIKADGTPGPNFSRASSQRTMAVS